jgi:hypothetical protein
MPDYSGFYGGHNTTDVKRFLELFVAEVVFVRRRKAKDASVSTKTRRMVCTLNFKLLNSDFGKRTLKFRPPHQTAPYNAAKKGLVTVWDLFMQDWRNIDIKSCVIIQKQGEDSLPMAVNTEEEQSKFIQFYNKKLIRMDLRKFMDT